MTKYILITGGVISGVGKGIIASSTGLLLKSLGLRVTAIKIDPYLNIDAGTISPLDHGEVFVLDDGGEVDMDLGNYERFLDVTLTSDHNLTSGKIYRHVIDKERKGDYLGRTVQVVPHLTGAIQDWIERVAAIPVDAEGAQPDVCIVELGGTVGDIESAPFIEAMRQFQFRVGQGHFLNVHVSLVPVVGSVGEQKTKPTQASVRDLRGLGIAPDIIVCRSTKPLEASIKEKISMFCHVPAEQVIAVHDCNSIYHVPLLLESQGLLHVLMQRFQLTRSPRTADTAFFNGWKELVRRYDDTQAPWVRIALVGKYTHLSDSYISVVKALQHAALHANKRLHVEMIEASNLVLEGSEPDAHTAAWAALRASQGVVIPGAFGDRGIEGMILACQYARTSKVPLLGLCVGLQVSVIEVARHCLHLEGATSAEFNPNTPHPVVIYMPEISKTHLGGTMRLGTRISKFVSECKTKTLYGGGAVIHERHRHRYEVNPEYVERLEASGQLKFVAIDDTKVRMEVMEYPDHPYYVCVQSHPELKSKPLAPSPLFVGLIEAATATCSAA